MAVSQRLWPWLVTSTLKLVSQAYVRLNLTQPLVARRRCNKWLCRFHECCHVCDEQLACDCRPNLGGCRLYMSLLNLVVATLLSLFLDDWKEFPSRMFISQSVREPLLA